MLKEKLNLFLKIIFRFKNNKISKIEQIEYQRKKTLLYGSHFFAILVLSFLLFLDFSQKDIKSFINSKRFIINISVLIITSINIIFLRITANLQITIYVALITIGFTFFYVYYSSAEKTNALWFYVYPLLAFFLAGKNIGLFLTFFLFFFSISTTFILKKEFLIGFNLREVVKYFSGFLLITVLSRIFEYYRQEAQDKFINEIDKKEKAVKVKTEFLRKISHQLKTPLNNIVYHFNTLSKVKLRKEDKEKFDSSFNSTLSLLKIINKSLNLAQIDPQSIEEDKENDNNHKEEFDLLATLSSIEEEFYKKAMKNGINFAMIIDHKVYQKVYASPIKFRILLFKIFNQALNLTKKKDLILKIKTKKETNFYTNIQFMILNNLNIQTKGKKRIFKIFTNNSSFDILKTIHQTQKPKIKMSKHKNLSITYSLTLEKSKQDNFKEKIKKTLTIKEILFVNNNEILTKLVSEILYKEDILLDTTQNIEKAILKIKQNDFSNHNYSIVVINQEEITHTKEIIKLCHLLPTLVIINKAFNQEKNINESLVYLKRPFQKKNFFFSIQKLLERNQKKKKSKKIKDNILIVEDNLVNQKIIKSVLSSLGKDEVDIAFDGLEAIEYYQKKEYQLILMDCHMPSMNGYDATSKIRSIEKKKKRKKVIIAAITANSIIGDQDKCFLSGMDDYVSKPILKENMKNLLNKYL